MRRERIFDMLLYSIALLSYPYASRAVGSMPSRYTFLLLAALAVMVLGMLAQVGVQNTFSKYSQMRAMSGLTASEVAKELLRSNGSSVQVRPTGGALTDNYNPKAGCVSLSQSVYSSTSVAAIAVAAHECGHVMQYQNGYAAIKLRNALLPAANIGSRFSYLLVILGIFMGSFGYTVSMIGVVLFGAVLLFQLLTLPIELDASRRAMDMLNAGGYIAIGEEESAAKKVLRAAAFTYVVAVLSAAISFLRLLAIAQSNRRR